MSIDELRNKKLQEYLAKQQEAAQEEQLLQQQVKILEENVKKHMTKEAFSRYTNLKIAHSEFAIQVLVMLNQAVESGKLRLINDQDFRSVLMKIQNTRPEFKIRRK